MASSESFNQVMAARFREAADLLDEQDADPFRVAAYRRAARTVDDLAEPLPDIYARAGFAGLVDIPTIGNALARAVTDIIDVGHWSLLERLQGEHDAERLLGTVAGVGPLLAHRLHDELEVETLVQLEADAHDGRLGRLPGFGDKRVQSIADSLAGRLRSRREHEPDREPEEPTTEELLDIDREYRHKVAHGQLAEVTPRRFNPDERRRIPILHTARDHIHLTALWSNSALANRLDRTEDWVVISADPPHHGQWTVVTETSGRRKGLRVVRGRPPAGHPDTARPARGSSGGQGGP